MVVYNLKFAECREEQLLHGHRKWKVQNFLGSKFASKWFLRKSVMMALMEVGELVISMGGREFHILGKRFKKK